MKQYLKITNKKIEMLIKLILVFSCPFLTCILSNRFEKVEILIGMILAFLIFGYIVFKKVKIKKINTKKLIISIFIAFYMINVLLDYCDTNKSFIISAFHFFNIFISDGIMIKLVGIAASFALIYFVYIFLENIGPKVIKFFKGFSKSEKLYFLIVIILSTIMSTAISHYTNAFSIPEDNTHVAIYDAIYVSDSGYITAFDAYFNVSNRMNDIRQPLFGIFSLPFSVPAKILSECCFFLPDGYEYETIMMIVQSILISLTIIMIGRMFNLDEKYKKYLYIFFHASFTYILWSFVLEQYVIGTFYLILTLYVYFKNKEQINYVYVGAVGTLITSGIIFPVITKFKNIKQWITNVCKCFMLFISIFIIGGQLPQIFTVGDRFSKLLIENGGMKVGLLDRLQQYFEFIKDIFIAAGGYVKGVDIGFPSYALIPISSFWYLGIVILVLCILGYILNKKEKFAKVCMLWIIFSFFITVVIGYGTQERCLILYALYFSWAYLGLIFMLLKKVFKKYNIFKIVIIVLSFLILLISLREFINILRFAVRYYPLVF